ncbi:hypothetical protein P171DRAFT_427327 [Karstenula rhodostoma CBS 690.94]|uniref:Uncharacterized protein n=1 Tax=Karstenula rhodostoma CBS 690.94 TaxID=1392251 RepID=A0A9P4PTJ8_9PLEO|nr:hypothetical protein P171DRAFT_427327 [Karstenula rhodostoma CBS 690.94]
MPRDEMPGTSDGTREFKGTDKRSNRATEVFTSAPMDDMTSQLSATSLKGCPCCCDDCECAYCCCGNCSERGQCNCTEPCKCAGDHCPLPCGGCCPDCTCPMQKPLKKDRRWSDNMFCLVPGPGRVRLESYIMKDIGVADWRNGQRRGRSHSPRTDDDHRSYRNCDHNYGLWERGSCQSPPPPVQATASHQICKENSTDKLFDALYLSKDLPFPREFPVVFPVYRLNFPWRGRRRTGIDSRWNRFPFSRSRSPANQEVEMPAGGGSDEPTEADTTHHGSPPVPSGAGAHQSHHRDSPVPSEAGPSTTAYHSAPRSRTETIVLLLAGIESIQAQIDNLGSDTLDPIQDQVNILRRNTEYLALQMGDPARSPASTMVTLPIIDDVPEIPQDGTSPATRSAGSLPERPRYLRTPSPPTPNESSASHSSTSKCLPPARYGAWFDETGQAYSA